PMAIRPDGERSEEQAEKEANGHHFQEEALERIERSPQRMHGEALHGCPSSRSRQISPPLSPEISASRTAPASRKVSSPADSRTRARAVGLRASEWIVCSSGMNSRPSRASTPHR